MKEIPVAEVIENAIKDDPFRSNILSQGSHVFSEADIELFFASLEQEQPVIHSKKETGILPPTRFGNQWAFEEFAVEYTFESLYAQADAVARLIVGDWLSEDTELSVTDYEASVVDTFKGDLPKTITLKQNGCSKDSKGHPLFTYGNEVLLFLKAEEDASNTYGILESYTSVIDVSYDDQGLAYYVVRHDDFGATVPGQTLDDYQESYDIYNNLLEQDLMIGRERDILRQNSQRINPYMYPVNELNEWFEAQKNG